jgi:hypothetical protein
MLRPSVNCSSRLLDNVRTAKAIRMIQIGSSAMTRSKIRKTVGYGRLCANRVVYHSEMNDRAARVPDGQI